jgi:hypothetical protein
VAHPGQVVTFAASSLPMNGTADIYVAETNLGTGTIANGSVSVALPVPSTVSAGVHSTELRVRNSGVTADCAVLIKGAAVTPATTATLTPPPNGEGWNRAPVSVALSAVDIPGGAGIKQLDYAASGAQTIAPTTQAGASATFTISNEGDTTVLFHATDNGGISEALQTLQLEIDVTPPAITFTGNQSVYGILDTIQISCAATDNLSGVAATTCPSVNEPAWQLPPGTNTITARASDFADNIGSGSTTFTVHVSTGDLCTLTDQFIAGASLNPSQANLLGSSLCSQLRAVQAAQARGNLKAKAGAVAAYVNQVMASTPRVFTGQEATILTRLAQAL